MKTVGERLKELRTKQNLSQEEVSNVLGTSKQTIHKYEKNIIENIPLDRIETLAKLYDTTPSYITGWEEKKLTCPITFIKEPQKEENSEIHMIVAHAMEDLTQEEIEDVKDFIKFLKSKRK